MAIRPANSRITHGLRLPDGCCNVPLSVSATEWAEDRLVDPGMVCESGAGMDAPCEIPTSSLKAFFTENNGSKYCFGFCQRTTKRPE